MSKLKFKPAVNKKWNNFNRIENTQKHKRTAQQNIVESQNSQQNREQRKKEKCVQYIANIDIITKHAIDSGYHFRFRQIDDSIVAFRELSQTKVSQHKLCAVSLHFVFYIFFINCCSFFLASCFGRRNSFNVYVMPSCQWLMCEQSCLSSKSCHFLGRYPIRAPFKNCRLALFFLLSPLFTVRVK